MFECAMLKIVRGGVRNQNAASQTALLGCFPSALEPVYAAIGALPAFVLTSWLRVRDR